MEPGGKETGTSMRPWYPLRGGWMIAVVQKNLQIYKMMDK
jgi:hypothetical protein